MEAGRKKNCFFGSAFPGAAPYFHKDEDPNNKSTNPATQFAGGLLLPQPPCVRFKLADSIRFVQNKIRDNAHMGISFSQPVIPSKSKKPQPPD